MCVNGKILGIVAKDAVSSTCINTAFKKTEGSFLVNGIASKKYLAPSSVSLSNQAKM